MTRLVTLIIVTAAAALAASAPAFTATAVECRGDATVVPDPASFESRQSGPVTVTSFDFAGTHSLCDRAGRRVEGSWAGHATQMALPDGRTLLFIRGHEAFDGATLDVAGLIEISPSGEWRVVHGRASNGTGWLEGATTSILEVYPLAPGVLGFRSIITWR